LDLKLAKCARCDKLFNKILSEVCVLCQPEEDEDFRRIRDVLVVSTGLNAQQVAEEAGVQVECVIRLLREGRIDNVTHDEDVACGRCGAPAISETKRLCKRCLVALDRECAIAMHEMRARILAKASSDMNDVTQAVDNRRASARQKRRKEGVPAPVPDKMPKRRMVVPTQLRRGVGKKS